MGHSARDLAPGGRALRLDQVGQIFNNDHQTFDRAFRSSQRNRGRCCCKRAAVGPSEFYFGLSDFASPGAAAKGGEVLALGPRDQSVDWSSLRRFVFETE